MIFLLPTAYLCASGLAVDCNDTTKISDNAGKFTVIIEGYDWGPAVQRIVLEVASNNFDSNHQAYDIEVSRSSEQGEIPEAQVNGKRQATYAYRSDKQGLRNGSGDHLTLVLSVAPNDPLSAPFQYFWAEGGGRNHWIEYEIKVTHKPTGEQWNEQSARIIKPIEDFDLGGQFTKDEISLNYAFYTPTMGHGQRPLIIWLHGGGEGGDDPSIPLMANRAANYASPDIQMHFNGAFVLVPQCPGAWMHNAEGISTRGKEEDIYHQSLMQLIREVVEKNPGIDPNRIYLGGCSNGGYMTLKLILEHPNYFAAGFISALAYRSVFITDEQIEKIKQVPIWFIHAADDEVTDPKRTVLPIYDRLISAGASQIHLSYYDHVTDVTGFYGGDEYHYNGHWSWIYSHANHCWKDYDGNPVQINGKNVRIMEWLAHQSTN